MERRRWPMNPFVFGMKGPEHAWLAPELHELLRLAQQEAASRGMAEISVEHFLLGALVYNDARTMRLFVALGLDPKALRSSILDRIGPLDAPIEDDVRAVPFSLELQLCVDQAVAATHACDITFVPPEHLLLSVLSGQWQLLSNQLLDLLGTSDEWRTLLPVCMELAQQERRLLFYIQNLVHFLSRSQEPALSFENIPGQEQAKQILRGLDTALQDGPQSALRLERPMLQELLLVGSPHTIGRRLVEALATERGVRLLSFAFANLVTMCVPFTTYGEIKRSPNQSFSAQDQHFSRRAVALARRILQRFFARAQHLSPCIMLLEDLDAGDFAGRTRLDDICDQLLILLFEEIERLNEAGTSHILMIATATHGLDASLQRLEARGLLPGRHFQR